MSNEINGAAAAAAHQFNLARGARLHLNVGGYDMTWEATQPCSIVGGPQVAVAIDALAGMGVLVRVHDMARDAGLRSRLRAALRVLFAA